MPKHPNICSKSNQDNQPNQNALEIIKLSEWKQLIEQWNG